MTEPTQPVMGYLIPYEWQEPGEPMNGDSDDVPADECDDSDFDDEGVFTL